MSKIGKTPISFNNDVSFVKDDKKLTVKGPKGTIDINLIEGINVDVAESEIKVTLKNKDMENGKAYWGLVRSLINNAVIGVSSGYLKELELVGVGYRVEKQGNDLKILIGYSHPVIVKSIEGIKLEIEGNTLIKVSGIDKCVVGQFAANIRRIREPEPYKGKGIKYKEEIVRKKQGKSA